jgi:hypothetical protein
MDANFRSESSGIWLWDLGFFRPVMTLSHVSAIGRLRAPEKL